MSRGVLRIEVCSHGVLCEIIKHRGVVLVLGRGVAKKSILPRGGTTKILPSALRSSGARNSFRSTRQRPRPAYGTRFGVLSSQRQAGFFRNAYLPLIRCGVCKKPKEFAGAAPKRRVSGAMGFPEMKSKL